MEQRKSIPLGNSARGTVDAGSLKKGSYKTAGITGSRKNEAAFFTLVNAVEKASYSMERWSKIIDKAGDKLDRYSSRVYSISNMTKLLNKQIKTQATYINKTISASKTQFNQTKKLIKTIDKSQKRIRISIDKTNSKKTKQKDITVKQGNLVSRDSTGRLVINQSYINSVAKKKGKNAFQTNQIIEQLRSEAQSIIDTYNGMLDSAQESLDEAKALQLELRDKVKDIYFGWENELTEIKNLQNKIDLTKTVGDVIESMQSLLESQLKGSFGSATKGIYGYGQLINSQIDNMIKSVNQQQQLIGMYSEQLTQDVSRKDEYAAWQNAKDEAKLLKKKYGEASAEYIKAQGEADYYYQQFQAVKLGQQYSTVTRNDDGSIDVEFDWRKLEADRSARKITDSQYEAIKEYYERILDDAKQLQEAGIDLRNELGQFYDMRTDTVQQMDSTAKTIASGMQSQQENTIKSLETISSTIKDAFDKLIDSVRKELEKQRRIEQNQKTEKDISDKMNRLAMLRANSSGGNQVEIAKLEKEIQEATSNYTDTLEDQLLDDLQESADKAAEQRERQISILQSQLEYTKSIGEYIFRAQELVKIIANPEASEEERAAALEEAKGYYALGTNGGEILTEWGEMLAAGEWDVAADKITHFSETISKLDEIIAELEERIKYNKLAGGDLTEASKTLEEAGSNKAFAENLLANGAAGQDVINAFAAAGVSKKDTLKAMKQAGYVASDFISTTYEGEGVTAKDLKGVGFTFDELEGTYDYSTLKDAGFTVTDFRKGGVSYDQADIDFTHKELAEDPIYKAEQDYRQFLIDRGTRYKKNSKDQKHWGQIGSAGLKAQIKRGKKFGKTPYQVAKDLANTDKLTWLQVMKALKGAKYDPKQIKGWNSKADKNSAFVKAFNKVFSPKKGKKTAWASYATGGLADYTGPAWLDGTPSKPELVLNPSDTKNFLALRDILGNVMHSLNSTGESYNNATYDININVDHINSDYDVDRMVERVKRDIIKSSNYRNVTQVRNFR